jgi:hypothetical protein
VKLTTAKCSLKACTLRGTSKNVTRIRVTVNRHGTKTRVVRATLKGGKWTAKVKRLKAGTTKFTVRGFASDGSSSAPVAKKVRLR